MDKIDNQRESTDRIEYSPVFPKTTQGGSKIISDGKWLVRNTLKEILQIVQKLISRRGHLIRTNHLSLSPKAGARTARLDKIFPLQIGNIIVYNSCQQDQEYKAF